MKYYLFLLFFIFNINTSLLSKNLINDSQKDKKINLNNYFPIINSKEKYSLFDDSEYLIVTKNSRKKESIILDSIFKNNVSIHTIFSIGPSLNKNASVGVKLISDIDTNQFLIIQINKNGQYSVSRNINKNDWKKNRVINKNEGYNSIQIKSKKNKYEIFINDTFVHIVDKTNSKNIFAGINISSQSKSRISFFSIQETKYSNSNASHNQLSHKKNIKKSIEKYTYTQNSYKMNGAVYTVQIGAFLAEKEFLLDSKEIWLKKTKQNTFIYYSGNFLTDIEATIHKNNLEKKGYKNIFVTKIEKPSNEE